jgi:hypothetical protein
VTKCSVCGSENEAAALFCGTCGNPLSPSGAKAIANESETIPTAGPDDGDGAVVPGGDKSKTELGTGGEGGGTGTTGDGPTGSGGGTEVVGPDPDPDPPGTTIVCPVCSTVNDAALTYCKKCASELRPPMKKDEGTTVVADGTHISPLVIGLGVAAVLVAVALVALLANGGGPGASMSPTPPASLVAPTVIPTTEVSPPSTPAPPSGRIAFARCPGGDAACVLVIVAADGSGTPQTFTDPEGRSATQPCFSTDGTRLIYATPEGLQRLTLASLEVVSHSTGPTDADACWSPDDVDIVFAGARARDPGPDSDLEIRLDKAAGATSQPLTENELADQDPAFTFDGKSVIWVQGSGARRELQLLSTDRATARQLTNNDVADTDPAVSLVDGRVVYASGASGTFDLYVLTIGSGAPERLTSMAGDERDPAWSPDGRFVVFSGGSAGSRDLYLLDMTVVGATPIRFAQSTGDADANPTWGR